MVEPHTFIFVGDDELQKTKKIEFLQKKLFPPELRELNLSIHDGDDKQRSPSSLKESLGCLPTQGAKGRLVVIRRAHKLNKKQSSLILDWLKTAEREPTWLILDVGAASKETERFVSAFSGSSAQVVRFAGKVPVSVFELGRAITQKQPASAIRILSVLRQRREKATNILGALFWQWDQLYAKKRVSQAVYKKGLSLFHEADRQLKSSIAVKYQTKSLVLETLAIKLAYLV